MWPNTMLYFSIIESNFDLRIIFRTVTLALLIVF